MVWIFVCNYIIWNIFCNNIFCIYNYIIFNSNIWYDNSIFVNLNIIFNSNWSCLSFIKFK